MKPIKFRIFNYHSNKIQIPNEIDIGHYLFGADGIDVMEYIGRKDRNGIEIYENDIIVNHGEYKSKATVKWCDLLLGFYMDGPAIMYFIDCESNDLEVIGNTYLSANLL